MGTVPRGSGVAARMRRRISADVAARAQVHEGVRPVFEADGDLLELDGEAREILGRAEVDVDLGPKAAADPGRAGGRVGGIPGNDDLARGHEAGQVAGRYLFLPGDLPELGGESPFSGLFDLCHDVIPEDKNSV